MRKLKVMSLLLLIVSAGGFLAFNGYTKLVKDHTPPQITMTSDELEVEVDATEKDLLKGVKATDKRSGDVTDSLVVEEISAFTEEGVRQVTYAAVDDSMNVARAYRTIRYKNYQPPRFQMSGSLCFPIGEKIDILGKVGAVSELDGNLSSKVKYTTEKVVSDDQTGHYAIEFRVMDSAGNTVYLKTDAEILDRSYAAIDVELSQYLVYHPKGQAFDAMQYYKGSSVDGALSVNSIVDVQQEGAYLVDYVVRNGSMAGKARLVVVVE